MRSVLGTFLLSEHQLEKSDSIYMVLCVITIIPVYFPILSRKNIRKVFIERIIVL